jgi:hypothetical protein
VLKGWLASRGEARFALGRVSVSGQAARPVGGGDQGRRLGQSIRGPLSCVAGKGSGGEEVARQQREVKERRTKSTSRQRHGEQTN